MDPTDGNAAPKAGDFDYGADAPVTDFKTAQSEIADAVARLEAASAAYAKAAKAASDAEAALLAISEGELPAILERHRVTSLTLADGTTVTLGEKIVQSIAAANRDKAYDWLEQNGHADCIKRSIEASLGLSEAAKAQSIVEELRKMGVTAVAGRKVEPATLKKVCIDRMEKGKPLPMDLFGIHKRRICEVSKPKSKSSI